MPPRRLAALVAGSVAALVVTGCAGKDAPTASVTTAPTHASATATPRPTHTARPASSGGGPKLGALRVRGVPGPGGAARYHTVRSERPVHLSVPAIGVDADVIELGIQPDGAIEVPTDWRQVGWLRTSSSPGDQGPAVLAGHVDSTSGPAVFYLLSDLKPGDAIVVTRRDGSTARFTVDSVQRFSKASFPTQEVYGAVPAPALRLITCGGDYDTSRGGYQDNVVVFAS